ncbi:replication-relaxation family protein [Neobacillus sp. WH10]|uniref:replication-relaxation family protein n=1 Tax=Neobacillus sp. WH10 TaxID=3047873 RepID=UPI0024C156F7|nr:replication-relaxation family protein [Neobacillus sp. WH10]WHY77305.1 replication-relaxation family protein [Neobacillus sp. WH10]
MKKRDLAILNDLQRFRCLTRDDIINLHFNSLKQPVTCCNTVLKRLRRDGYIEVSTKQLPYIYFASPSPIKKDSTKIPHFLKIAEFYKSLIKYESPKYFIVEPKYGKGYMEPDAFMLWKRGPFFVEIQRSIYSDKVMEEKVKRYEDYYLSNEWKQEAWQPQNKKVFPAVIMITDTLYKIDSPFIKFHQVPHIEHLVKMFEPKKTEYLPIKVSSSSFKLKTI